MLSDSGSKPVLQNLTSYFGYAEAAIEEFRRQKAEIALVPASPYHQTGQIAYELGITLEKGDPESFKLNGVAALLTILIKRQLNPTADEIRHGRPFTQLSQEELLKTFDAVDKEGKTGQKFECALTRFKGRGCLYLVIPDNQHIDYERLKQDLAEVKNSLKEIKAPESNPIPRTKQSGVMWLGPYDREQMQSVQNILPFVTHFHHRDGMHAGAYSAAGNTTYLTLQKGEMSRIFSKEGLSLHREIGVPN